MSEKHLIQVLPPQLANQIAAGEVVERPASVVKELVENSLDAGANNIQIDIEKGGSQLIRIRDNGCGIAKYDLELALARHATSKIANLEDLEAILSFGFRGEALASISSVSRLTLTSRTAEQSEAWQAYAQGREMAVEIQPASHPVGTTIEVANLFFNTPARRKFLRTDKTEFAHIDEVVRRIALAKPNISFTLTHNDKIVRQYRKVLDNSIEQQQRRVAAICGDDFIHQANHIDWQHGDMHLHGWIGSPRLARAQNDLCYSYVNGRMMRDKTINHAIRLAYGELINSSLYPAFVVFLDIDPTQVDVNVHPAKHEVRFHQARLVHDFILQGVSNALQTQGNLPLKNELNEPLPSYQVDSNRQAAGQNIYVSPNVGKTSNSSFQNLERPSQAVKFPQNFARKSSSSSAQSQRWYNELVKTEPIQQGKTVGGASAHQIEQKSEPPVIFAKEISTERLETKWAEAHSTMATSQVLSVVKNQAILLKENEDFFLISLEKLARLRFSIQLQQAESQTLLIPLNLMLDEKQAEHWQKVKTELEKLGFQISEKHWQDQTRLSISAVPKCLREQNFQQILYKLLNEQAVDLAEFFANYCEIPTAWSLSEAIGLLAEMEQAEPKALHALKIGIDLLKHL